MRGDLVSIEEHVINAKKGNKTAFYALMDMYKIQLYKIAYRYLKNEEDALEAIQEMTYRAYKNIHKLKQPRYFKTWLTRILINYCLDEQKKKKRVLLTNKDNDFENTNENFQDKDARIIINWAIDQLSPNEKKVIILKYLEDYTIKEIACSFKGPEGTIKTWLNRGLSTLRHILKKEGE